MQANKQSAAWKWAVAIVSVCVLAGSLRADESQVKAGVASRTITPGESMWMAGYGNRNKPAEGKLQDLHVKALALEDLAGEKLVLVTSDLVGVPRELTDAVAETVRQRAGLPRERLMITVSHTHCGPVLRGSLNDMYNMPPDQWQKVDAYTEQLRGWMIDTLLDAMAHLKPARLAIGKGTARFAVNRRKPTPNGFINDRNPAGPVDHDVPVLTVKTPEGELRAVVLGYACHNTTLQFYQWCGDYAGFAQQYLEERHPGATALFWMGCGADANPLPRSTVPLCQKYGRELADAVEGVLGSSMTPVKGTFSARYARIELPFDRLPSREQLSADLLSKNFALQRRAARLLKKLETGEKLDEGYAFFPVQIWKLGNDLLWVALGGEVVVDYSLRLKKEFAGARPVWITGYANDVMAYIPSLRVLKEGGYEGDTSMIYYGMPSKWAASIEERVLGKVHELVKDLSK
jgi:neutral ceramidase